MAARHGGIARKLALAAAFAAAVPAACAQRPVPWVHPSLPQARAADDLAACRRWADDQVDPGRFADAQTVSPLAAYDRDRMRRQLSALVSGCMEAKGYRPRR